MMSFKNYLILVCVITVVVVATASDNEDFYKLLNVARDATSKEIRQAFKKLAVKLHPDKNKDDKDAETKFIRITKAYEILKEPESRKKYDLYGDTGEDKKHNYHSYTYYRDVFGIYDDDPLITTLSRADYELSIIDSSQAWFVNFYSPHCHHCHELAPTWRKLARNLEGVVRIAAVNCEEDWMICHELSIDSYPTLLFYEKAARLFDGQFYNGKRTLEDLEDFVISKLTADVVPIQDEIWDSDEFKKQPWLLLLCPPNNPNCPERNSQIKLATSLEGLMSVGLIKDKELSKKFTSDYIKNPIVFWQLTEFSEIHIVGGSDFKEIVENVLSLLPDLQHLNDEAFSDARTRLRLGSDKPWLICFYMGTATQLNLHLKRLPAVLPHMNLGMIHCGKNADLCSSLHVNHYPAWGVLKSGGAFELHHGQNGFHEIVTFAKDSSKSTNLHALSPADFYTIVKDGSGAWFIDWYAPWCPPCKRLMPEIRKASQHFSPENVKFGTIDCTLHTNLCSREGVMSYPTTTWHNGSKVHHFRGVLNERGIIEFVEDMLNPKVIELDSSTFGRLETKPENEMWLVDYYAPWCNPCQMLAPELRKLAKQIADIDYIKIAQVDCDANPELCSAQNVRAYPTIRLYPLGSKGMNTVAIYNSHRDAMSMKSWLTGFLPSTVEKLDAKSFKKKILWKSYVLPWLIDFYAPWCHHCIHFEPNFIATALALEGVVKSGKVDCETERVLCRELKVTSYPTVILYLSPNERVFIDSQDKSKIISLVKEHIKKGKQYVKDEL
ncbi:dnaJ homolog subfamily C member 10-like [Agrilus planipennis]|uniref:DnaJ homolog subfamily C member 10-like n=1 Tax=Agrilus planipennis TaxID=224129 RepID=A0A1W4XRD8_AGRPL|nr:dnaJ homolog subfamily C member 10-like [Agrilus planipennis]